LDPKLAKANQSLLDEAESSANENTSKLIELIKELISQTNNSEGRAEQSRIAIRNIRIDYIQVGRSQKISLNKLLLL
jgi:hypothetical protein